MPWITTCVRACVHAAKAHPVAAIAAPPVVIGATAAVILALAPPPPKPTPACGCTSRWVAPRFVTTPKGAAQIIAYKAEIALASIPPEGWTRRIPHVPTPGTPAPSTPGAHHDVPEPSSAALIATGALGILIARRRRCRKARG